MQNVFYLRVKYTFQSSNKEYGPTMTKMYNLETTRDGAPRLVRFKKNAKNPYLENTFYKYFRC